jgi:hypothetical protein
MPITEITDRALVSIECSQFAGELESLLEFKVTTSDKKAPVKTMNRARRAIAITRGTPDFTWTSTAVIAPSNPEIDWNQLALDGRSGHYFQFYYQRNEDGDRFHCVDCWIDDVGEPYSEGGDMKVDLSGGMLDRVEE